MIFSELPRSLHILQTANFGSKGTCGGPKYGVGAGCLADGHSYHVFLRSLVVVFGHR